jgi:hypothetical protein
MRLISNGNNVVFQYGPVVSILSIIQRQELFKCFLLLVILTVLICSCANHQKGNNKEYITKAAIKIPGKANDLAYRNTDELKKSAKNGVKRSLKIDSLKAALERNMNFFADSLLKAGKTVIQTYRARYQKDTCGIITYRNSVLKEEFEDVKIIKGISRHKTVDSVFVMPPFNYCDEGDSYCFYDKTLPRLYTDSYCCHPDNLFVINDIDEDGIKEIGIYYSSCASRYKALVIYSLKNGGWKRIGDSIFDIATRDPGKVQFDQLVKKISKRKFKICNFVDGQTKWETIRM